MPAGLRKLTLSFHLTVSVGWIGAVAAYLVFDITVATTHNADTLRTGYLAMDRIVRFVIVPFAIASLLSGVGISIGTKWGLFRHYWVVISLLLTTFATIVLFREARVIAYFADVAATSRSSAPHLRALGSTLVHSVGGAVVLLVILVLNVYKPRGLTRHGRRRERELRGAPGAE